MSRSAAILLMLPSMAFHAAHANEIAWEGALEDSRWFVGENWAGDVAPNGVADVAVFGPSPLTNVSMPGDTPATVELAGIRFTNDSPLYNFQLGASLSGFRAIHFRDSGIVNEGTEEHFFNHAFGLFDFREDSAISGPVKIQLTTSSQMRFLENSAAGETNIVLFGSAGVGFPASLEFSSTAKAQQATIEIQNETAVYFNGDSTANQAELTLKPGTPGGSLYFRDNATAAQSNIFVQTSGNVARGLFFEDNATAADAIIEVGSGGWLGNLRFSDDSTAGNATITQHSDFPSPLVFENQASSADATINGLFSLDFFNDSTAATSTITMDAPVSKTALFRLHSQATLADATVTLKGAGAILRFQNNSSGGQAAVTLEGGRIETNIHDGPVISLGSIDGLTGTVNSGISIFEVGSLDADMEYGGHFAGGATEIHKVGTGKWTFLDTTTADNNVKFEVKEGILAVENEFNFNITTRVESNGTLRGTGNAGVIQLNGGSIRPGNSIGILGGRNMTWNSGTVGIRLGSDDAPANSDRLVITSTITKGSGPGFVFDFSQGNGTPVVNEEYILISAAVVSGFSASDFSFTQDFGADQLDGEFIVTGNQVRFLVTSFGLLTPFQQWLADRNYTDPDPNSDPEGFGIPNLIRYALNLPDVPAAALAAMGNAQIVEDGDTFLELPYTKLVGLSDSTVEVRFSRDLEEWHPLSELGGTDIPTGNDGPETELRRARIPTDGEEKFFVRIIATMQ